MKNVCYLYNTLGLGASVMCIGRFLMSYTFGVEIIVMNCIGVGMGFKCSHMLHMLQKGLDESMFQVLLHLQVVTCILVAMGAL